VALQLNNLSLLHTSISDETLAHRSKLYLVIMMPSMFVVGIK